MGDTYLTGGELTALTMVYWTPDPFLNCDQRWLENAMGRLDELKLVKSEERGWYLTPKGKCLMDAINAIPEPVNQWVIP